MKKIIYLSFIISLSACSSQEQNLISPVDTVTLLQTNKVSQKRFSDNQLKSMYSKPVAQWPKGLVDQGVVYKELGNLPNPKHPANNPYSLDKAELGRNLFFDNRMSRYNMFSCATCHNQNINWADDLDKPLGNDKLPLKRNSPTVVNTAYHTSMFWDGRAKTLEDQAHDVLLNPREMNSNENLIKRNFSNDEMYLSLFKKAFGDEEVNLERVTMALATFQRTLNTKNNSSFDKFIKGNSNALDSSQLRGLHLFRTKARCINCHNGANLSDDNFHNTGLVMQETNFEDLGKFDNTQKPEDFGVFRTASLRNVVKTSPYFHHGQTKSIKEVLDMYNSGMPQAQNKSKLIKPLGLDKIELQDLENFLDSLSEDIPVVRKPSINK